VAWPGICSVEALRVSGCCIQLTPIDPVVWMKRPLNRGQVRVHVPEVLLTKDVCIVGLSQWLQLPLDPVSCPVRPCACALIDVVMVPCQGVEDACICKPCCAQGRLTGLTGPWQSNFVDDPRLELEMESWRSMRGAIHKRCSLTKRGSAQGPKEDSAVQSDGKRTRRGMVAWEPAQ